MKTEFVRFLLPLSVLLLACALEEALPKVWSVGFPFLMAATLFLVRGENRVGTVLWAVVAGLLEDICGGLPPATTASYLLLAALAARALPDVRLAPLAAYPLYQLWLAVWTSLSAGELWGRLLVSVPLAALTALAVGPALLALERRVLPDAR